MSETLVTIRRSWDDPGSARVALEHLKGVRQRNDPGCVCSAFPRVFVAARVWCDQLAVNESWHVCNAATAPHELEVCVLEGDNPPALMERLK